MIKAIGTKVIVQTIIPEKVTKSGIILQPKNEEKPGKAIVVSIGPDVMSDTFNEGDTIFFNKYVGAEIEHEDNKYLVLKLDEIYAVV